MSETRYLYLGKFVKCTLGSGRTVEKIKVEIELKARSRSKLGAILSVFHAKNDKETIVAWRSDLNTILEVFNVGLVRSTIWRSLTISC